MIQQRDRARGNIPLLPVCMQSTPSREFCSLTCRDLIDASVSIGLKPEFSANAIGTESSASAKARMAYCSNPGLCGWGVSRGMVVGRGGSETFTAASSTAKEQAISAAPPP